MTLETAIKSPPDTTAKSKLLMGSTRLYNPIPSAPIFLDKMTEKRKLNIPVVKFVKMSNDDFL